MAKSARRSGKGKAPAASPVSASGASTPTSQSGPLPPFTQAPECLTPFLKLLSPEEVYLIHIDRSDVDLKKQTFIIPAVTNVLIIALIALRVYMGRTMYPALFATVVGLASPVNDTASLNWTELASVIFRRALPVLFDYLLVVTFLPWPIRFFAGPIEWRRRIGFRSQEIIVRRSQPTVSQNLERNRWVREDEEMRDKIVAAVTPDRLLKTGYLLVDADWGLDYPAMIKAHELVGASSSTPKGSGASSHLPLDEFRTAVLVNTDNDGWIIWHVGDENTEEGRTRSKQRDQILDFKEKLTEMGHEALFFRWVELIQYESTQPGGFTAERQASAMVQAKQLFEEAGVDFNGFWQEVGGMEGFGDDVDAEVDAEVDVDKFAEQLD
ncbi:uncharacterized protein APUU_30673S [Aspergillus puulaauensis]|uniref:Uncharacterized protein n=1 Tax=Aspergillus puulaauensis TaxID=1220207 RepID=A0A7R8AMA7_9EURO|nr:uncharacterized protein APUU_30673S [Aspergillus puulaauensis]BCS22448.1 hypothetical protein APUU_30673S [Aspergillus puulaauensis]